VLLALLMAGLALSMVPAVWWNLQPPAEQGKELAAKIDRQGDELTQQATALARRLEALGGGGTARDRSTLVERASQTHPGTTFLVGSPDSQGALVWAGPDLRHPVPWIELGERDFSAVSSMTSVSRFASVRAKADGSPLVVAARSDSTSRLPLASYAQQPPSRRQRVWSLRLVSRLESDSLFDEWHERTIRGDHLLRIRRDVAAHRAGPRQALLLVAVAFGLLALWSVRDLLLWSLPSPLALDVGARRMLVGALAALGLAGAFLWRAGGGEEIAVLLPGVAGLCLVGLPSKGRQTASLRRREGLVLALGVGILLAGLSAWFYRWIDLGSFTRLSESILAGADVWALRVGLALVYWAVALRVGKVIPASLGVARRRAVGLLAAFILAALIGCLSLAAEQLWVFGLLSVLAIASLCWASSNSSGWAQRWFLFAGSAAVALALAVAWQRCASRTTFAEAALGQGRVLDAASAERFAVAIDESWRELQLTDLAVGHPDSLSRVDDVALALWEASPLAEVAGLSALAVEDSEGRVISSFSYGLPLARGVADLDLGSRRWPDGGFDTWWNNAIVAIDSELFVDGRKWGVAKLWLMPLVRPVAVDWQAEGGTVATDLLLGSRLEAWELPDGSALVVTTASTRSANDAGPPQPHRRIGVGAWTSVDLAGTGATAEIGSTAPLKWERSALGGWELSRTLPDLQATTVLRVPSRSMAQRLLSAAMPAAAVVAASALALCLSTALLLIISPALRLAASRALLSYSRKLVVVVIGLAVVPLALFNVFLFRSAQQRSTADQRKAGETGLRASERLLAEYLPTVRPGYSLNSVFEDGLLDWLPVVIGSELNLYWRGGVSTTSRPELLTAGLIPLLLPSEIESALAARPNEVAVRESRGVAEASHFEIYKRLSLGLDGSEGDSGLVLSIPLLGQGRESADQFERLAQQSLLLNVALLMVLLTVGRLLARNFSRPIEEIVAGTVRISEGANRLDLDPREPELAALVRAVDVMARRVSTSRAALLSEKQLLETVLGNVTSAVIAIGRTGGVVISNPRARQLFDVVPGAELAQLLARPPLDALPEEFFADDRLQRRSLSLGPSAAPDATEGPVELALVWVPTTSSDDLQGLLIAEDVTEVLRGQRLAAWAQMTRMIAHEIKNPLTPIRLSAEHLRRVRREHPERLDEVFEACIHNILEQVEELQHTAAEFSAFYRLPNLELRREDLRMTVRAVVEGYRHADKVRVEWHAAPDDLPLLVLHDERLIARIVRNLIENAMASCARSARQGLIRVSCEAEPGAWAAVSVSDNGVGVASAELERIFEPNFSTKSGGTGLGLAIARRIAEQHGGSLSARDNQPHGLQVVLRLPIRPAETKPADEDGIRPS
jgi:signal transduction histidine kinase